MSLQDKGAHRKPPTFIINPCLFCSENAEYKKQGKKSLKSKKRERLSLITDSQFYCRIISETFEASFQSKSVLKMFKENSCQSRNLY